MNLLQSLHSKKGSASSRTCFFSGKRPQAEHCAAHPNADANGFVQVDVSLVKLEVVAPSAAALDEGPDFRRNHDIATLRVVLSVEGLRGRRRGKAMACRRSQRARGVAV